MTSEGEPTFTALGESRRPSVTAPLSARAGEGTPGDAPLLRVADLRVSFGGVQAVAGASFSVRRGALTGLIGPNGAGKTTAVNAIAGQQRKASGRVVFEGQEILGRRPEEVARLGLLRTFQTANLFGRMTVMENLLMGAPPWEGERLRASIFGRRKWHRRESELARKALGVMHQFGVLDLADKLTSELSGGQKRIVEIMRAFMGEPKMLLLDEPLAGINPSLGRTIGEHLLRMRDAGVTMLMIEHDLGVIEELCDPVIVMAQGMVLSEGSLAELRQNEEVVSAYLAG